MPHKPEEERNAAENYEANMEAFYGKDWKTYREPLNCPHCNADLRNLVDGPPFKREIAICDIKLDRTVSWQCPDCSHQWPC